MATHTRLYGMLGCGVVSAALLTGCAAGPTHPCILWRLGEIGQCGTVSVYENRSRKTGRQIDLHVIVLPARGRQVAADPVVWLTGGPGLAAAENPTAVANFFAALRTHHDIVLVDQRGTGQSSPLPCRLYATNQSYMDPMFPIERVRECRRKLERIADLTHYTTDDAMDDLADVLTALGYRTADLIGGSYGTRAALVFLRRHPDRVRRVALDGVMPPNVPVFSATPRAIARELAVIDSGHLVDSAMRRLPITVQGVTITPRAFAERMFSMMYVPSRGQRAVRLLRQALGGDWVPFANAVLTQSRRQKEGRYLGMTLSVLCAEDAALLTRAPSPPGTPVAAELLAACAEWPHEVVAPDDTMLVSATAPVLLISGGLDPATPPELADSAARGLPNSVRFVDSTAGHAMFYDRQVALLTAFIDR